MEDCGLSFRKHSKHEKVSTYLIIITITDDSISYGEICVLQKITRTSKYLNKTYIPVIDGTYFKIIIAKRPDEWTDGQKISLLNSYCILKSPRVMSGYTNIFFIIYLESYIRQEATSTQNTCIAPHLLREQYLLFRRILLP